MKKLWTITVHFFCLLGIVFIPFTFSIFSFQQNLTNLLFKPLLVFIANSLLDFNLKNPEISSDSILLYLLAVLLFIIALLFAVIFTNFINIKGDRYTQLILLLRKIIAYYLVLIFLKYGLDKLFKTQFYLPEPNILYTPFGQLDKDILYWSTMGTSYSYNIILGAIEIITALLILYNRTRTLGLILGVFVLFQILAVNFCFDISVKLFSIFLLLLSLIAVSNQLQLVYKFFVLQQSISLNKSEDKIRINSPFWSVSFKAFVIGLIVLEAFFPYFNSLNFNDDKASRPYLHGAYKIVRSRLVNDSLSANQNFIQHVFIHRNGYIIFQDNENRMLDYKLTIDTLSRQFIMEDYNRKIYKCSYVYNSKDSLLSFEYGTNGHLFLLKAKALYWRKLPAINSNFHWMID